MYHTSQFLFTKCFVKYLDHWHSTSESDQDIILLWAEGVHTNNLKRYQQLIPELSNNIMLLRSGENDQLVTKSMPPSLLKAEFDFISLMNSCGHIIANESLAVMMNTIFGLCPHNYLHLHFYTVNFMEVIPCMLFSSGLGKHMSMLGGHQSVGGTEGLYKLHLHSVSWSLMWRSYTLKPLNNLRHIHWNSHTNAKV